MKKRIFVGLILLILVFVTILYFFILSAPFKETPKIILEEEEACNPDLNLTFTKGITLSYKNSTFRVNLCKFSNIEEKENFIKLLISYLNEKLESSIDSWKGFSYVLPNQDGFVLSKDNWVLFCIGYANNLKYTQEICEWFVKNRVSEYL
jgi:hypothetical protein